MWGWKRSFRSCRLALTRFLELLVCRVEFTRVRGVRDLGKKKDEAPGRVDRDGD